MADESTDSGKGLSEGAGAGASGAQHIVAESVGDSATSEDSLGFEYYVDAVAKFLTSEGTAAPLSMSVEGEWGSGKSSFMLQLRDRLKRQLVVTFDAWIHEKEEALWAAFALALERQLSAQIRWRERQNARAGLLWQRVISAPTVANALHFIGLLVVFALFLLCVVAAVVFLVCLLTKCEFWQTLTHVGGQLLRVLSAIAGLGIVGWFLKVMGEHSAPLAGEISKALRSPGYA